MPEPMVVQTEEHLINRWWQLVACVVAMMAIANLQYAWTLFTLPLTQRLHATLSAVQLAFTLFILAETWLVPIEGYLVDRLGAWRIVTAGGLLVGVSWVWAGLATSLPALWVAYSIGGIGAGAVYGACVGTALTVIPIQQMIAARGDQAAFITWGLPRGSSSWWPPGSCALRRWAGSRQDGRRRRRRSGSRCTSRPSARRPGKWCRAAPSG